MKTKLIGAVIIIALAILWPLTKYQLEASTNKPAHYKNKVIVLMYHHIDTKESGATISPGRFGTDMKILKEYGYNVISAEQLLSFMRNKSKVPDNAVVITFDDGYDSFDQYAVPIMKKYNFVATDFIIGSSSDKQNVQTKHLSWETMRKLKAQGFSFYSHTYNQHDYAPLDKKGDKTGPKLCNPIFLPDKGRLETTQEYKDRVEADARLMEKRLKEELNNSYQMIAFPFGVFNSTAKQIEKNAGDNLFFTTQPGINKPGSDEVFRINAGTPRLTANKFLHMMKQYG
ncbi:polysaccharide deacetylase family protein [Paenibacillus glycanilyticus]|uniref:polysaccharide deacetylase family protein n=1 Tax=Paenibacillus glycanilyticus TaxID=126569 RepID=UPI00203ACDBE|nr:polysaccharide deacetylase family protein [Paenibacillus glycanilyticus]MCM3629109.1 polysaccharide deacetylase family protein [Paenibacillus glycanilyticus]